MPIDPDRVQSIFLAAIEASLSVRAAVLQRECGADAALRQRVEALLQAHDGTGSLPGHAMSVTVSGGVAATECTTGAAPVQVPGYQLLGELGHGGMGVVYKARQIKLDRLVALKMILAGSHAHAWELARFQTEGEAIARLQHPNIVQVYEVGEHEDKPYFSLEFCSGGSLAQKLNGTPLPAREAAALVETLARAMQAAHKQHVIHRDLKPANVLLSEAGTPKIADFGLAKKLDEAGQTQSGTHLGTPSYMAPEQAGGRSLEIGPSADVYALGAILYECLTGRPPFKAATALETMRQVVSNDPVPPTQLQPKTPVDVETICLKCLQKEPARRYGSAEALAEDLRRFQAGEPIRARPVGSVERVLKWARRRPAIAVLLLATVLGMAGMVWKYSDEQREAAKAKRARDFLVNMFRFSDTDIEEGDITARRILEAAEKRIPEEFADQPDLKMQLLDGIYQVKRAEAGTTPRAMILEVRGTVLLRSARNEIKEAIPQALLYSEDRLSLAADAQIQLVFLSDWHKELLKSAREVTVRRKGCEPPAAVTERTQDILMTFVRLPKGTFYMGHKGVNVNGKLTEIKEDVEIAVHTVTQGQWQAVMGNNPSCSRMGKGSNSVLDISDDELKLFPVEQVSWSDTQAFIKKLNEKERDSGFWYRLPTEAEWEYACRGGATSEEECSFSYYFAKPSNELSSEQANFNEAPKGRFLGRPTRVGAYPPNKLGLCDMHGNVWQWCADLFASEGSDRVLRGGCWYSFRTDCEAGCRCRGAPSFRYNDRGFRLARVPVATRASESKRLRNP